MERLNTHEKQRFEHKAELEKLAAERIKHLERRNENHEKRRQSVEAAREKLQQAEVAAVATERGTIDEATAKRPVLTKALSYKNTMASLRHQMKPAARSFSKFIHAPVVENTSELLGKTVMRPSLTLGATSAAVLIGGATYIYARSQGFVPPGSIIWISLIIGAVAGLLIEGLYKSVRALKR